MGKSGGVMPSGEDLETDRCFLAEMPITGRLRHALVDLSTAFIRTRRRRRRESVMDIEPLLLKEGALDAGTPNSLGNENRTPSSSAPDAIRHHDYTDRQRGPGRICRVPDAAARCQ